MLERVSILVVTYKADGILERCLASLDAECGCAPQIVVVDNSPSPATREIVARRANALYVASPGNPGFAGGNNRGLPLCDREFILLLNNDTEVRDRASIEELVRFLDAHPAAAAVQGDMVMPGENGGGATSCGRGGFLTPLGVVFCDGAFGAPAASPHAQKCFFAGGAFMMLRRAALRDAGGFLFRSSFWSYYEEAELCHRLWLAGFEVWYAPTPPIIHYCGRTSRMFDGNAVMRQYLCNELFSLSANLSFPVRWWLVSALWGVIAACAAIAAFRGRKSKAAAYFAALSTPWRERKRILAARRCAGRIRKMSDFAVMRHAMRMPPANWLRRSVSSST